MSGTQLVYVSRDPIRSVAGDATYVRAHARIAAEAGFVPHIFGAGRENAITETEYGIVHRVWSPFRPFRAAAMPLHAPFLSRAISRFLHANDGPVLIHSFGSWVYPVLSPWRSLTKSGRRCALIASTYDTHLREASARLAGSIPAHGRWRRWQNYIEYLWVRDVLDPRERDGYQASQLILVNYESVRRFLLDGYAQSETIRLAPYSSEMALLRSVSVSRRNDTANAPPLIVSLSRHDARKGIEILVKALAALKALGIPFRAKLIGTGPLLEANRRLARELGLGPETIIAGFIEDSFGELNQADVFVLPSLEEGSGSMSMIEAMQCGLAVIATNIDGIPEDVVNEDSALLVDAGDHNQMAGALKRILTDRSLRERLATRSREEFDRRFRPEPFRRALLQTYENLGFSP